MSKIRKFYDRNKKFIFIFLFINLVYLGVFRAFDLDIFPIYYGFLINVFAISLYFLYKSFTKKEKTFEDIKSHRNLDEDAKIILDEYYLLDKKYRSLLVAYDEMDTDLRDFYSLWIHEIKTPIAENRLLLAEDKPDIDLLIKNNKRIDNYINILLGFVRYNSKTNDYIFEDINIEKLVKDIVKEKSFDFISKNINLDLKNLSFMTVSDGKWLSFIISQVLNNSLKYCPDGGQVMIYFEGKNLVIEDTGLGIKKSDLPRVFEMGYTGENGRKLGSSTGLGLYLVDSISKDLNLAIRIESEEGEFTKFMIKFDKLTKL